jgi:hypothetical protein
MVSCAKGYLLPPMGKAEAVGHTQKKGEGGELFLSDELLSSYLRYRLGLLVLRLHEGSFNRLPVAVI